jgi:hypothetical protein
MCLGGCMVIFLDFTNLVFGRYVGERLPGYLWTSYAFANLTQFTLVVIIDVSAGYDIVLYILASFNMIGLIIVIFNKLQGGWENSMKYLEFKCYLE